MLGRQQWQLLHVEKDEQVIRLGKHKLHNNNKTWRANICEVALDLSELFRGKIFVLLLGHARNDVGRGMELLFELFFSCQSSEVTIFKGKN
jgi:hypothetical protein